MQILGKLMKHVRLIGRMADATQTDLVQAAEQGDLSQEDWADMVQTCRTCGWAGSCRDWLETHDKVDCAPDPCLNRARFAELKTLAESRGKEVS